MKLEALKRRLDKRRPMTAISMRFPADVIEDLKRVAPLRGFARIWSSLKKTPWPSWWKT